MPLITSAQGMIDPFPIFKNYRDCFFQIITANNVHVIDYSLTAAPIVLTVLDSGLVKAIRSLPVKSTLTNAEHLRCHTIAFTVFGLNFREWESTLRSALLIDVSFASPFWIAVKHLTVDAPPRRIYPKNFIFLTDDLSFKDELERNFIFGVEKDGLLKMAPTFILKYTLEIQQGTSSYVINRGWFVCWYCTDVLNGIALQSTFIVKSVSLHPFSCDTESCFESFTHVYQKEIQNGREIFWSIQYNHIYLEELSLTKNQDVFAKSYHARLGDAVGNFLIGSQNISLKITPRTNRERSYGRLFTSDVFEMEEYYPTGFTSTFNFITSNDVYQVKTNFEIYITPFEPQVWALIALSMLLVASVGPFVEAFIQGRQISVCKMSIIDTCICLFGGLVDQWHELKPSSPFLVKTSFYTILGTIWLFVALILNNIYKSIVKANHVLPHPFETRWEYLNELSEFKVFVPLRTCNKEIYKVYSLKGNYSVNDSSEIERRLAHFRCRGSEINFLIFEIPDVIKAMNDVTDLYDKMSRNQTEKSMLFQNIQAFHTIHSNLCYICSYHIAEFIEYIQDVWSSDKIALVFKHSEFEYYWGYYRKYMETSSTSFAHNRRIQNDYIFKKSVGIAISSGYDHNHKWVSNRARVLLQSGIYWFWEKWDAIHFPENPKHNLTSVNKPLPKPISFFKTDIHLIFLIFVFLLVFAIFIFGVESSLNRMHSLADIFRRSLLSCKIILHWICTIFQTFIIFPYLLCDVVFLWIYFSLLLI
ncbi:unnamed protein product [Allacma fusca]|uniref:Uncharacterized protein n=1 Tax=Allacma fusca TaxID=39272 RepID=A0A8J2P4I3_9HEXA|nr:unnamed protein product [Allacma fusca]